MDDAEAITVASAVVVPESSPERTKRRQESDPATLESSKRLRPNDQKRDGARPCGDDETTAGARATTGSTTDTADDGAPAPDARASRRRSGLEEEKKRGKRLFGALLGTIGKFQKDSTSQRARSNAVKRKEVEAKTYEKLRAQSVELDQQQKKVDDDFNLRRRMEYRDFEGRAMQIQNSTILAQANMLATSTEPKLYYLPWKLLTSEEDTIKAQAEAAKVVVSDAEAAFRRLRQQDEAELQAAGCGGGSRDSGLVEQVPEQDISIDSPPRDDIAEVIDNGDDTELKRTRSAEHTDSASLLSDARRNSDIGDPDIIEEGGEGGDGEGEGGEGGEDTVIY